MGNRYLAGNFGPVSEEVTAIDLPVTGTIPDFLDGRYLRNGPNPIGADPATYHWFTGFGMVHGVRVRDGRAQWYRNRYVRSDDVATALGEAPKPGADIHFMDFAANTNVVGQAGRTFAVVEGGMRPFELDDDLNTIGRCDFDGTLPGGYTAHPKVDPVSGEMHAISYYWGWGNNVQYTVIDRDAHVRKIVDIETTGSPMLHDMSLTEKYAVVYDLPVVFDAEMAMSGSGLPYKWDDEYPARVGLLPRDGEAGDVRWFDVEPCYVFHPMNAYDDGDRVVIDVVRHPKMFATDMHGPNEGMPSLDRWTIDVPAGKVLEDRIDDRGQEFPRVDERLVGRHHRYGYSVAAGLDGAGDVDLGGSELLRHDMASGEADAHAFGPRRGAGEFVMVPSSVDAAEDDGVLMGFVYDGNREASDLVLLDAASLETVAEVHLPVRVPYGFHGNWVRA